MWSLELITGLLCAAGVVLVCVILARYWSWQADHDTYDPQFYVVLSRGAIWLAILTPILAAAFTFPWEKQYHYWDDKAGVVAEIEARLLKDGDGMSEKYAVRFEGSTQEYGCEDTRCSLVKPGDTLTLRCIRVWEYSGTDGWDCAYVGVEK